MRLTPISPAGQQHGKAKRSPAPMAEAAALSSLIARVCTARILREHHIWEAVRILPDLAGLPEDIKQSPEFRSLMERDAFSAAVRFLAQSCQPPRNISSLEPKGDHWTATLSVNGRLLQPRRRNIARAEHRDPPACLLIALLNTATRKTKPFASPRRASPAARKEL